MPLLGGGASTRSLSLQSADLRAPPREHATRVEEVRLSPTHPSRLCCTHPCQEHTRRHVLLAGQSCTVGDCPEGHRVACCLARLPPRVAYASRPTRTQAWFAGVAISNVRYELPFCTTVRGPRGASHYLPESIRQTHMN